MHWGHVMSLYGCLNLAGLCCVDCHIGCFEGEVMKDDAFDVVIEGVMERMSF